MYPQQPGANFEGAYVMKTLKERTAAIETLERQIANIKNGRVHWIALSVKYHSGETLAIHTKGAPKRPRGLAA